MGRASGRTTELTGRTGRTTQLRRLAAKVPYWVYDVAAAVSVTTVALLLGHETPPAGWRELDARGALLTCAVNLPVAARRRAPVALCLGTYAVWAAYVALDYWPVVNSMGPLLALYTVASLRPVRHTLLCALLLAAVWNYAGTTGEEASWPTVLGQSVLYPVVLCCFGRLAGQAARRSVELADLAEQLRRERAGAERRAVAEERVSIARELHDVVAHHMSVISVQAGLAGYVFSSDPDTARGALDTISGTSAEALAELRRLLAVLRIEGNGELAGDDETYIPAPGLGHVAELAERVRHAGVAVELAVEEPDRPLPPGIGQCAYRVIQEALTNVVKHAPGSAVQVTVHHAPDRLEVTVRDDGRRQPEPEDAPQHRRGRAHGPQGAPDAQGAPGPQPPGTRTAGGVSRVPATGKGGSGTGGSGHGLIGMRERARIYGGSVTAGPRHDGGYEVRLVLPA